VCCRFEDALKWAEKALSLMQQMAGVKVHPALEPFFALVIELKNKTGGLTTATNDRLINIQLTPQ
jgi:hypothetical protein